MPAIPRDRQYERNERDIKQSFYDEKANKNGGKVDREKTCPFLLRVFVANSKHSDQDDYNNGRLPKNYEFQIYTWLDATLKELTILIREHFPGSRKKGTTFDFVHVYLSEENRRSYERSKRQQMDFAFSDIGLITSGKRGLEDGKTLKCCKFDIGDYLDVSITLPIAHLKNDNKSEEKDNVQEKQYNIRNINDCKRHISKERDEKVDRRDNDKIYPHPYKREQLSLSQCGEENYSRRQYENKIEEKDSINKSGLSSNKKKYEQNVLKERDRDYDERNNDRTFKHPNKERFPSSHNGDERYQRRKYEESRSNRSYDEKEYQRRPYNDESSHTNRYEPKEYKRRKYGN